MKKVILFSLLILLFSIPSIAEVDKITLANIDATTPPPPPEPDCCIYLERNSGFPDYQATVDVINKGTGGQPFALVDSFDLELPGDYCDYIQVDNNYIYCEGTRNMDGLVFSVYSKDSPYTLIDKFYFVEFGDPNASVVGPLALTSNYIYVMGYHTIPTSQYFFWIIDKSSIGGGHSISPPTVLSLPTYSSISLQSPVVIEDNFLLMVNSQGGSSWDVVYLGDGSQCPSGGGFTGNGACWTSPTNCSLQGYACEAHDAGVWFGPGSSCAGTLPPDPFPSGACHNPDGTCVTTYASQCGSVVYFGGNGTSCFENPSTTGACCNMDATCSVGTFEDCAMNLGVFRGKGTTCTLPQGRLNSISLKTCYPPQGACVKPSVNSCSLMTLQQCYQQSSYPEASQGAGHMLFNIGGGFVGFVGTAEEIISGTGNGCGDEILFAVGESFALGKYDKIEIPGIMELGIIYLVGGGSNHEFHTWYWDILFPNYPFRARSGGFCSDSYQLKLNAWFDFDSNYIYILDSYEHKIKVLHKLANVFGDPDSMIDSYSYNPVAYPWGKIAVSK